MKRFLAGFAICLILVWAFRACQDREPRDRIREESALIRTQLEQVSKLVVTEGHFSEVFSYRDSRELFGPLLTAEKKALVVVNARASVVYDLSRLAYRLDTLQRTLYIESIPEPEIRIDPTIEYYDVSADYFNPFGAADYNRVRDRVATTLRNKVEASSLKRNAENRLLSELAEFYVLTRSMGWTLVYEGRRLQAPPSPEILRD